MAAMSQADPRRGQLLIIGGSEAKEAGAPILGTLVALAGGSAARIALIPTASRDAAGKERLYGDLFRGMGARRVTCLPIESREEANREDFVQAVYDSTAVFLTGGDQNRISALLGGTEVAKAMHRANKTGLVVAGTSAGASAISEYMIADGGTGLHPRKHMLHLAPGLGLLRRVVVDQHFLQRQRLGRLLSIMAQNPFVLGIGVDEDTAMLVEQDCRMQVIGSGMVTILDCRELAESNVLSAQPGALLAMGNVRMHMLSAGWAYNIETRTLLGELPLPPSARASNTGESLAHPGP
jgi:cyanophycinase